MQDAIKVYLIIWILFLLPLIYLAFKYTLQAAKAKWRKKEAVIAILLLLSLPLYTGLCYGLYSHTLVSEPLLVVEQAATEALDRMDVCPWEGCKLQMPQSSEDTAEGRVYRVLLVNEAGEKCVVSVTLDDYNAMYPKALSADISTGEEADAYSQGLRYFDSSVYRG